MGSTSYRNALALPNGSPYGAALGLLVLLLLTISPFALTHFGWQYGATGGSALEKFHPGTVLAFALVFLAAIRIGNPLSALIAEASANPVLVLYIAGILLLVAHAVLVVHLPATVFIDTFILPIAVYIVFRDLGPQRRKTLARLIHVLFAANAILGLAEFALGFRLTPLVVENEVLVREWRSSAFFGHPLANAHLTGCYMILLLFGGGRDLPPLLRMPAFLLSAAAMIPFGGRAATVLVALACLIVMMQKMGAVLRGAKFDPRSVLAVLLVFPVLAMASVGLYEAGFFGQFLERFTHDEGSASTRIEMFQLFKHLSWYALLFGPDHDYIVSLMATYGLNYGIESFWIAMILGHGLLVSLPFFAVFLGFCWKVAKEAQYGGAAAMIYFLAVASTSVSLSAKSPVFGIFVMLLMILGRNGPQGQALVQANQTPRQAVGPSQDSQRTLEVV